MKALKTLIIGGARSGKSRLAEHMAINSQRSVVYIATATAGDAEMHARIAQHRERRPVEWRTVEEPTRLAGVLEEHAAMDRCLLVDCLTLWLSNLLLTSDAGTFAQERHALLTTLPHLPGQIIMVTNETGLGITPLGELSRRFCDESGWLHQEIAALCDRVVLTVAGLPHYLRGTP
jgi:adenosylcobinamide kinase/adenosylcobinamide-phosphate guanylyltransferase